MKLVVGLGNPEEKYTKTRHNVGFLVVDNLLQLSLPQEVVLKKSTDYMNNSGSFVVNTKNYYKLGGEDLFVIHDDLDLALGQYKIQFGVGPKDHKGILDIEESLATKDFWRVRIGVDNREPENRIPGEDYVLQKFNNQELELLEVQVFPKICEELGKILQNGK